MKRSLGWLLMCAALRVGVPCAAAMDPSKEEAPAPTIDNAASAAVQDAVRAVSLDEAAARQVAFTALAKMLIDMKPTAMSASHITYAATLAGRKCTVEVARAEDKEGLPRLSAGWLVTKVECDRMDR